MATKATREAHSTIIGGVKNLDKKMESISRQQALQYAAQTPITMLQGIQPPYFYGDEGEDVEAFIYALVNCASANDWKDNKTRPPAPGFVLKKGCAKNPGFCLYCLILGPVFRVSARPTGS